MLNGLTGSLLSHHFAERVLPEEFEGQLGESALTSTHKSFIHWWHRECAQLGPSSSIRAIWDVMAVPLVVRLGFTAPATVGSGAHLRYAIANGAGCHLVLLASAWDASLDSVWREAVRGGLHAEAPWALCTNARQWRLVDCRRTYHSRAYLQFDLPATIEHLPTFAVFWAVLREEAFRRPANGSPLVLRVMQASARHGHAVSRSLRSGVIEAVQHLLVGLSRCGRHELTQLMDESLTVVYRLLFLMFAESRGLVPNWHPIYRQSYTVESLRNRLEHREPPRGLWEAFQAIARLAHAGCHAGTLVVPPFNGRLFSPSRAPIAERCAVDDTIAQQALLALSTTKTRRRVRIDYRDLGVEQLGAVYESVLDYEPVADGTRAHAIVLRRGGDKRKSTGSFYTPQTITDYVVRRTLHPLVENATSDEILRLRIVDPAMGSAAFLVSACRYLARAYERALVAEGARHESDVDESQRASFRRLIAQRCLFGVDLNPTAVQLARLSLWLATLAANKPLTFLDHHLVCGNSLVGASPIDITRQPPGRSPRASNRAEMPLFLESDLEPTLAQAVTERRWLAETRDDTAEIVREKEKRLERIAGRSHWKSIADLWCACWMWPAPRQAPEPAVFASLVDRISGGRGGLPERLASDLLQQAAGITETHRFFHWAIEFPEAFFDDRGLPSTNGGFDAGLGNPPWDMLGAKEADRAFFRGSGVYRHQSPGHSNRYQLFLERALSLTRRGGRIGLVLPAGFATDHNSARLRRTLFATSSVDTITGLDNRKAIFPIHRSVRFLVVTSTTGTPTEQTACRFGIEDAAELETIPDGGDRATPSHPIRITRAFLAAIDETKLPIPELRTEYDARILERIVHSVPRLDAADGWNVRFGRELNATDDRAHFHRRGIGMPVLEGKHIDPFTVHVNRTDLRISERSASALLDAVATYRRPRLAYRDVASSTNRLSLIAAVLPPRVVSTHTLFCLKTPLSADSQAFLCAMLNSYVANYLVRQVMTTHLGSATVEALRVPRPAYDSPLFIAIVDLVHSLTAERAGGHARIQALAAACYRLSAGEFAHILTTFPLVSDSARAAALDEFRRCPIFE